MGNSCGRQQPGTSWEVCIVLPVSYCLKPTFNFGMVFSFAFMFKCIDFRAVPFAFSFCKDWWRKVALGTDPLFVVNLAVSILKIKMDDGLCISPICSVISANVRTRFVLCRTRFWFPSVFCSVVFWIAALIPALLQGWALVLSFPWLLSHLSFKQSHGCLLGRPSISICSCNNNVSRHLSDYFFFAWNHPSSCVLANLYG